MQTFLPYASFSQSASVLDQKRLGKQRVENLQIMSVLAGASKGWVNHPAVLMWRDFEHLLLDYHKAIIFEWVEMRGYKDNTLASVYQVFSFVGPHHDPGEPSWLGDEDFHRSHQSNLIRKDPKFYGPKFPGVPDDLPYIWPVTKKDFENEV